jgi:hypothetical protein
LWTKFRAIEINELNDDLWKFNSPKRVTTPRVFLFICTEFRAHNVSVWEWAMTENFEESSTQSYERKTKNFISGWWLVYLVNDGMFCVYFHIHAERLSFVDEESTVAKGLKIVYLIIIDTDPPEWEACCGDLLLLVWEQCNSH